MSDTNARKSKRSPATDSEAADAPTRDDERAHESAVQPARDDRDAAAPDHSATEDVESLKAQLAEANNRWMRTQAELENYRKRSQREMEDVRRYAALPLVRDILHVMDNLDRAIEHAEQNENGAGLLEGVKMVASQLTDVLQQHHCTRIEAQGATFDPHVHEALAQEPSETHPANSVSREMRVGYQLHDRVIRPAQVFVSSGPPAQSNSDTSDQSTP